MVLVSVVIPTYNRKKLLQKSVRSLLRQSYKNFEIIIVDDGSSDGTENVVKKFKAVKYIKQKRRGPATARNTGIKSAKGEIIAFTDDDCEVDCNWLKSIVLSFRENKEYDAIKGNTKIKTKDKNSFVYHIHKHIYISKNSAATNNIAYKKKALESINFFDEYFHFNYEDCDLLMRFKMKGYKIMYCREAVVYHVFEKNPREFKRKHFISGLGMSYFFKKYLSKNPTVSFLVIYHTLLELIYLPKFLLTRLTKEKYYFSKEYLKIIKSTNVIKGFFIGLITNPKQMSKYI